MFHRHFLAVVAISSVALAGFVWSRLAVAPQATAAQTRDAACRAPVIAGGDEVLVPAGRYRMGSDGGPDGRFIEETRRREVRVAAFAIDRTEVTNVQFAAFVRATGYVTEAERVPSPGDGVPEEQRMPGAAVFVMGDTPVWRFVVGASWRQPLGPGSSIAGLGNHPVTMVTFSDARAYAHWAGREIPSEAEWEWAARAGPDDEDWGEPEAAEGHWRANTWQGVFPVRNLGKDGHMRTAPVGCFPPNPRGLYDMIGNVWELTADSFAADNGGARASVIKGGSFLCSANYCARYRPTARQPAEVGLGMSNVGFRTIRRL